jgi:hypothetical protein
MGIMTTEIEIARLRKSLMRANFGIVCIGLALVLHLLTHLLK